MKIEEQVCNLELAKKLKELGVKQESLFYYADHKDWGRDKRGRLKILDKGLILGFFPHGEKSFIETEHYSAFTVAELGEMLFRNEDKYLNKWIVNCFKTKFEEENKKWVIGNNFPLRDATWIDYGATEANARAKMLIYLLENKLTK